MVFIYFFSIFVYQTDFYKHGNIDVSDSEKMTNIDTEAKFSDNGNQQEHNNYQAQIGLFKVEVETCLLAQMVD
jgi:hypothetical protein